MEKLFDFFQDKQVKGILDVGTGTADFISVLKKAFPKANITGVDPNTESLETASNNFPEISFMEMSAEKLEFSNNSFDVVSISMALHHLPDIKKSLFEIQRVVKSDGWIIINELFTDNLSPAQEGHKMYHHFRSKIDRLLGISHSETFAKDEILRMVENSGMEVLFHFEFDSMAEPVKSREELNERMKKMQIHLNQINGQPEYDQLKLQIDEFQESFIKNGFQTPTKIVIVGKSGSSI